MEIRNFLIISTFSSEEINHIFAVDSDDDDNQDDDDEDDVMRTLNINKRNSIGWFIGRNILRPTPIQHIYPLTLERFFSFNPQRQYVDVFVALI